jgi:hypothetical protein
MIRRANGLERMKIVFITHLSICVSKLVLTLKIMNFENVVLIEVVHICDKRHECIIYMRWDQL